MKPQYRLRTVQAALSLIEVFLTSPKNQLGVSEIAIETGMGKTEVYRLLQNLAEFNYIQEDPETRKYRLGVKFLFAGQVVSERIDLLREAQPVLDDLSRETGETVHLLLASPQGPVCVAERQSSHQLRYYTRIGILLPWHAGAASKALLAFKSRDFQQGVLAGGSLVSYAPETIVDPVVLRAELDRIAADGYATSTSELTPGAREAAVPIRDHVGDTVASVSVVGPAERMNDAKLAEAVTRVVAAGQRISLRLGFVPA